MYLNRHKVDVHLTWLTHNTSKVTLGIIERILVVVEEIGSSRAKDEFPDIKKDQSIKLFSGILEYLRW